MYIPMILNFTDFCLFHSSGDPIYLVDGVLRVDFDLTIGVHTKYSFLEDNSKKLVENGIRDHWDMFDVDMSDSFFYQHSNLKMKNNRVSNICGYILTLKPEFRNHRY